MTIPLVSNLTGELATPAQVCDPDYWVRHVREPVRFHDGVRRLRARGVETFLELGPDATLSALGPGCVDADADVAFVPVQRRDRAEELGLLTALARCHTRGVKVDWERLLAGRGGRRVELPTYAFQRRRYWSQAPSGTSTAGDATGLGQVATEHPLLGAVVPLPDSDGVVLTGRLSLDTQPWLADHAVLGTVLLPGTAFVELAVHAGDQVGCNLLEELTLRTPLVLDAAGRGAVQVQVAVGGADEAGRRPVRVHSRAQNGTPHSAQNGTPLGAKGRTRNGVPNPPWTLHAEGILAAGTAGTAGTAGEAGTVLPPADLVQWPPAGAEPVEVTEAYGLLAEQGYAYGPVFQGLTAAWRRPAPAGHPDQGTEVFAEVALPEVAHADAGRFGLHPALLDAAMHAALLGDRDRDPDPGRDGTAPVLPFVWGGVSLHATGATALRVRMVPSGRDSVSLAVADPTGRPVLSVQSLVSRPVSAEQLGSAGGGGPSEALFGVEWRPVVPSATAGDVSLAQWRDRNAPPGGKPAPDAVVFECDTPAGDVLPQASAVAHGALRAVQGWLADERFAGARLVVVTRGAVSVDGSDVDLAQAPVWGLVRAAQAEHPGRFVLIDTDDTAASAGSLRAAVACGEPELAIRAGELRAPRLAPATPEHPAPGEQRTRPPAELAEHPAPEFGPGGTVLITGGTGGLGALLARHLVAEHGVRHLVLTSRRGPNAPGAAGLRAELAGLGAQITIAACDVADRDALAELLAGHPVTAVVHAAGIADNGLIGSATADRFDAALAAKAGGAWHLHELTKHRNLTAFVLISSAGGLVLAAGQASYAAANVFLDALAAHRRAAGLTATSMAFGPWAGTGMGLRMTEADLARTARQGLPALPPEEGLASFDAALRAGRALIVPLRVDPAALRASTVELPALLRGLVPAPARQAAQPGGADALRRRLAALPADRRAGALLDVVRAHAAAVLGHDRPDRVETHRGFLDIGFDSLAALELRSRLAGATGLRLPPMLIFDYPTVAALTGHLHAQLSGAEEDGTTETGPTGAGATDVRPARTRPTEPGPDHDLSSATAAELFDIIDNELGELGEFEAQGRRGR